MNLFYCADYPDSVCLLCQMLLGSSKPDLVFQTCSHLAFNKGSRKVLSFHTEPLKVCEVCGHDKKCFWVPGKISVVEVCLVIKNCDSLVPDTDGAGDGQIRNLCRNPGSFS